MEYVYKDGDYNCDKCGKHHYPNEYQIKQSSSCCGVDWSPIKKEL